MCRDFLFNILNRSDKPPYLQKYFLMNMYKYLVHENREIGLMEADKLPASLKIKRARDGDRTRDPLLGKEVLHHWATRA